MKLCYPMKYMDTGIKGCYGIWPEGVNQLIPEPLFFQHDILEFRPYHRSQPKEFPSLLPTHLPLALLPAKEDRKRDGLGKAKVLRDLMDANKGTTSAKDSKGMKETTSLSSKPDPRASIAAQELKVASDRNRNNGHEGWPRLERLRVNAQCQNQNAVNWEEVLKGHLESFNAFIQSYAKETLQKISRDLAASQPEANVTDDYPLPHTCRCLSRQVCQRCNPILADIWNSNKLLTSWLLDIDRDIIHVYNGGTTLMQKSNVLRLKLEALAHANTPLLHLLVHRRMLGYYKVLCLWHL